MSFPQKIKSTLWAIVDNMACNTAQFVKYPGRDFTRDRKLGGTADLFLPLHGKRLHRT